MSAMPWCLSSHSRSRGSISFGVCPVSFDWLEAPASRISRDKARRREPKAKLAVRNPVRYRDRALPAWMLVALDKDGTEIVSYGGFTTAMSLDSLLKYAGSLTPRPGDKVEFMP